MVFDPQVEAMRASRIAEAAPQLYTLDITAARAADLASIQAAGGDPEPVHQVLDQSIPGPGGSLPLRIYRPAGDAAQPVLVYCFGGGWTLGSIDTADAICRTLANTVPCTVVTVGYRLAPEHRFPAAVRDCYAALDWISNHADDFGVDPARLAIGGDSAGGNLAAAVTLLGQSRGGPPIAAQLLVYPNTSYLADTASMREGTDPWLFNQHSVAWYWQHYLASPQDGTDPLASPLLAPDLHGLPPALVITAEHDPLRDEGEQYAARLREAAVPVRLSRYDGMVHGFFAMAGVLDAGRAAQAEAAEFLRERFG